MGFLLFTTVCAVRAVVNQPPIADADGPYFGYVGVPLTLDGSGSYDPDGSIILHEWDLDGDGEYDDATGVTVTHTFPLTGTYPWIGLRVTDEYGESDTDTTTVTIVETAAITAHKWHDHNFNGVQEAGEEDIEGWRIELYICENEGAAWVKVAEGSTAADGTITFDGLSTAELYKVVEEELPGWIPTTVTFHVVDTAAGVAPMCEFGNVYVPTNAIPEVPFGTVVASASMIIALIAYMTMPRWRRKPR
jgi:PKD repeat protein